LKIYLGLLRSELQAMTAFEPSMAQRVLPQCKGSCEIRRKLSRTRSLLDGVDRFQSACKMQYDGRGRRLKPAMRAEVVRW
jgi:hypothetical protein